MMSRFGLQEKDAPYFLPPYEWYNDSIANWTNQFGFKLINYTPGHLVMQTIPMKVIKITAAAKLFTTLLLIMKKQNQPG
jgi:peptidoglycan/xylan/chitin deacetylase (PgdA/CDA1 family)